MPRPLSLAALLAVAFGVSALLLLQRSGADAAVRPPAGVIIGINANTQGYGKSAGLIQEQLRDGHLRHIREDVSWAVVEPTPGARRWGRYDALFASAARRGLKILPLIQGTPGWAGPTRTTVPDDPTAYAEFVGRFAARYGRDGTFWAANPDLPNLAPTWFEIWNEPVFRTTTAGDINPGRYARLYQAVVRQARVVAPRARFLLYAHGPVQLGDGRWVQWIDELFAAVPDLAQDIHGISTHPYSNDLRSYDPQRGHDQFSRIRTYKQRFKDFGADVPLWITEMGWSTCTLRPRCVSSAKQASLVRELMTRLRTTYRGLVAATYFYSYANPGENPRDPEHHFGLVGFHRTPKPAWKELTAILSRKPR